MSYLKKILIIHTGGTISMIEDKETGSVSTTKKHPLSGVSCYVETYAEVDETIVLSLPSPHITPKNMVMVANKINESIDEYDGIIITHGTDTLEETAYFLNLVIDTDKPIIVTGAMRSANEIGSDALYNLISSVRVAASPESANKGVLVVMNDEIHPANNVTKTSTSNIATFKSPQYGPVGIVTKEKVIFHHTLLSRRIYPIKNMDKKVYLLIAVAGMEGDIIQAISHLQPDGLVIEGLGQGNLPKDILDGLQQLINDHIPIVLVSRCYQGIVQPIYAYEGGGKQLKDMGLIFTNGLTGPKARLKLMVALESTNSTDELREIFEEEL